MNHHIESPQEDTTKHGEVLRTTVRVFLLHAYSRFLPCLTFTQQWSPVIDSL